MASLNKVLLLGNLTRDPDLKYTQSGTAICTLGLAVNRRYTTSQGQEHEDVCFVDIDVFGRQAETCKSYLQKGAPAMIEGRLRYDQWEDRQSGERRSRLKVTAERVQFIGAPRGGTSFGQIGQPGEPPRSAPSTANPPVGGAAQGMTAAPAPAAPPPHDGAAPDAGSDGEIPF